MFRRTLKLAWYKRGRYSLTIVAIGLAVAFIVSTLLFTSSISGVGAPYGTAYAGVDTVVVGDEVAAADGGPLSTALTAPVPVEVVDELQAAGYDATGMNTVYAQVLDSGGAASGQDQTSSNVAEPWLGDSDLNAFDIVEGAAPAEVGEVALDASTADEAGLAVGDSIEYVTADGVQQGELVGITSFGGADNEPYVSTLLLDPGDPTLAPGQGFERVLVAGDGSSEAVTSDVTELLGTTSGGDGLTIETGTTWVDDQIATVNDFLGFFEVFLTSFAVIAVVVGIVIIANTFTVSLAQRTQELALLRLVGTTRRQLLSQVVLEALLLGIAGTAIGLAAGVLGMGLMGSFVDLLGLSVERSSSIATTPLIIGAVVGVGVTVAAAVWPARKATSVAPIQALHQAELEPPSAGRRRSTIAAALGVGGAIGLIYGALQASLAIVGLGILGLFLGVYLGGEMIVRAIARAARPVLARVGPTGTVASRNLERNAGRTAAAASALMIGVTLIAFFTLMAATISQFIAGDAADKLTADYVVSSIGDEPEPVLGAPVLESIENTDGVELTVPISLATVTPENAPVTSGGGPGENILTVATADIADLEQTFELDVIDGSLAQVGDTDVILSETAADQRDLAVGDVIEVTALSGRVDLDVVAIVSTSLPTGFDSPAVISTTDLAGTLGVEDAASYAYVLASAGSSLDADALNSSIGLPTITARTADDFLDSLGAPLDVLLALVYALLGVALTIALIGIANTVSLAISERVGEIAAIRAAGANIRQIFWSLITEFGLLALVGVGSGIGLAWVSATGLFRALSEGEITVPQTSLVTGLVIVAVGIAGGMLAAWIPARNAARADLLTVLRAE